MISDLALFEHILFFQKNESSNIHLLCQNSLIDFRFQNMTSIQSIKFNYIHSNTFNFQQKYAAVL